MFWLLNTDEHKEFDRDMIVRIVENTYTVTPIHSGSIKTT
jgi:hypothetical protein